MEASKQCPFRKQSLECPHTNVYGGIPYYEYCSVCLQGQQNDELGLLSGAIMALIESKVIGWQH